MIYLIVCIEITTTAKDGVGGRDKFVKTNRAQLFKASLA